MYFKRFNMQVWYTVEQLNNSLTLPNYYHFIISFVINEHLLYLLYSRLYKNAVINFNTYF